MKLYSTYVNSIDIKIKILYNSIMIDIIRRKIIFVKIKILQKGLTIQRMDPVTDSSITCAAVISDVPGVPTQKASASTVSERKLTPVTF